MVKRIIIVAILGVAALTVWTFRRDLMDWWRGESRTINTSEVKLLLREDLDLSTLIKLLLDEGVVSNDDAIRAYVSEKNLDTTNFAAGKYVVLTGTRIPDLVEGFVKDEEGNGKAEVKVNVVFNRCRTIEDVGSNISKCILADSASIVDFIYNAETLKKYGFSREQVPALFLPATYEMYFDTDAEAFVAFMAQKFKAFWNEDRMNALKAVGLKYPSQAVTVASIVYAEQSQMKEEWPIIAKLYLNRLDKGMLLQSDPTFRFCWGDQLDGVERLLNKHREIDCAYNTYLYAGLPPGPINLPPQEVIEAVLHPAQVDYLFMCGKPGGSGHNFAVSGSQHERNVAVYRKWLKEYLKNKE